MHAKLSDVSGTGEPSFAPSNSKESSPDEEKLQFQELSGHKEKDEELDTPAP